MNHALFYAFFIRGKKKGFNNSPSIGLFINFSGHSLSVIPPSYKDRKLSYTVKDEWKNLFR